MKTVMDVLNSLGKEHFGKKIRVLFDNGTRGTSEWFFHSDRIVSHYRITTNYILIYVK